MTPRLFHPRPLPGAFLLTVAGVAAVLGGCAKSDSGDDQIRVEHVAKEPASITTSAMSGNVAAPVAPRPPMQALPGMAEFVASAKTPTWSPPTDWQADPPNAMRKGSWRAPAGTAAANQAEISVNIFQGQLGGLLANVNRWRGQVGLPGDLTDARLAESVKNITLGGRPAQLVSLDGPNGQSLEGALIFMPDRVWTFRLAGSTVAVNAQRTAFRAFLSSVQWQD